MPDSDNQILQLIAAEERRQLQNLELIASENFASPEVRFVTASVLTHKYAEGYPGKRYYGGCEVVDQVEELAIERARRLFKAGYVNVQPHSGSTANMVVFFTCLNPGDTVLGMDLSHGGHLTHGAKVSFSGKWYSSFSYGVDRESEQIDYDAVQKLAQEVRPKLIIAGASSYPRIIDFPRFRQIADEVGALLMVDMAHIAGLVATGLHPSPLPHADVVTTTTHKTLRGPRGGMLLLQKDGPNPLGIIAKKSKRVRNFSELLDAAVMPGIQGGPLMHVIAAKAVSFLEALDPSFTKYQQQVIKNAQTLAEVFRRNGVRVITGGTDNHLVLIDVSSLQLTGAEAESLLDKSGITVNKNTIPFDTRSSLVTSGVRFGTPALTTRGLREEDMETVGEFILEVLKGGEKTTAVVLNKVRNFTQQFPLFSESGRESVYESVVQ